MKDKRYGRPVNQQPAPVQPPAVRRSVPQQEAQWYQPARSQEQLSWYTRQQQQVPQAQQQQNPWAQQQPPHGYYAPQQTPPGRRIPQEPPRQEYGPPQPQQAQHGYQAPQTQQQPPQGYYAPRHQQRPMQQQPQQQGYYPPQQHQQPARGYHPGQAPGVPRVQPKPQRAPFNLKKFIPALILLVLIIVAGALGVSGINASRERAAREQTAREQAAVQQQQADAIRQKVESYRDRFCPGVYVNGIDLGGKTYEEAKTAVEAGIQAQHADWKVTLTYGENHADITAADLNFTVDVTGVLNEAMQQGHTGSDEQRYADMLQLEQTPYRVSTARPTGSTQKIDDLLAAIKNSIDRPAQDAYYTLDPENINAPFQFFDEVYGLTLDTEPIRKWIFEKLSTMENGTYAITPAQVEPSIRKADLMHRYTLRASAWTEIHTSSTEDRNNNIRHALHDFVNGYKLAPGETFSFNNVVGYRTAERGFFPAQEIVYGNYVEGYGGGVCQASTTIYQAALCAGLQIVKREPHSDSVSYTDYGKDATVYWFKGGKKIDFSFKNNTDGDIFILAFVQTDPMNKKRLVARVIIYGRDMEGVTYDLVANEVETLPCLLAPKYVADKADVAKAKEGHVVESWRVEYTNGRETGRKFLYKDTYKPKPEKIYDPSLAGS